MENVYFISLGCAKNRVDSEHMLGVLKAEGCRVVPRLEDADVAVVNTCGFIQSAVEETIDTILEVCSQKGKGPLKRVFVASLPLPCLFVIISTLTASCDSFVLC